MASGRTHVYTGNGKGKSSAAIGSAIRAAGQGLEVAIIQLMKPLEPETGENKILRGITQIRIYQYPGNLLGGEADRYQAIDSIKAGIAKAHELMTNETSAVLIIDEALTAVALNLLPANALLELINGKPDDLELILTGRGAPPEICAASDYVTEMIDIKHPFSEGLEARKGIEF